MPVADVDEMAGDRGSRGHGRRDQMGAALDSPDGPRSCGSRSRRSARGAQPVVVHGEAHRAARLAPFEAGLDEDLVETLGLGLLLHEPEPGTIIALTRRRRPSCPRRPSATARRSSMRPLVQEPMKTRSIGDVGHLRAGRQAHVVERALLGVALVLVLDQSGSGTMPVIATTSSGEEPQVTIGGSLAASSTTTLSKCAPSSVWSVFQ